MKKVKILGKSIPILVLVLLGVGMVSATVLTYFGVLTQTVTVDQAVVLDCTDNVCVETTSTSGGRTAISGEHTLTSQTSVVVPVKLVTTAINETGGSEAGVTTKVMGSLKLVKKNTDWTIVPNTGIFITYTIVGNVFESSGVPDGYTLIYYKDKGTYENDADRLLVLGKSALLSENMPHANDWNVGEFADYCNNAYDSYKHCKGAKLWAVPDNKIVDGALVWSNPETFYFETDLIEYNKEGNINIYPGEVLDFKVHTTFSTANTGIYTVTTEAQV